MQRLQAEVSESHANMEVLQDDLDGAHRALRSANAQMDALRDALQKAQQQQTPTPAAGSTAAPAAAQQQQQQQQQPAVAHAAVQVPDREMGVGGAGPGAGEQAAATRGTAVLDVAHQAAAGGGLAGAGPVAGGQQQQGGAVAIPSAAGFLSAGNPGVTGGQAGIAELSPAAAGAEAALLAGDAPDVVGVDAASHGELSLGAMLLTLLAEEPTSSAALLRTHLGDVLEHTGACYCASR